MVKVMVWVGRVAVALISVRRVISALVVVVVSRQSSVEAVEKHQMLIRGVLVSGRVAKAVIKRSI
jgi:hypothetical protein